MTRLALTYPRLMGTSLDAGNAHMRRHGRTVWTLDDWSAAAAKAEALREHLIACELMRNAHAAGGIDPTNGAKP